MKSVKLVEFPLYLISTKIIRNGKGAFTYPHLFYLWGEEK